MKRLIVDYKKLTTEILDLLVTQYPDGYDDEHVIEFTLANSEVVEAIEVRSEDAIYLVKIGSKLTQAIKKHEEEADFDEDFDFPQLDDDDRLDEDDDSLDD